MSIRIAVVDLPRMLAQIVRALLAKEEDFEIVQPGGATELDRLVEETRADVVILGSRGREAPEAVARLLKEHPRLRLFVITPNGRDAFRVELQPQTTSIKEISSQRLVDEIRAVVEGNGPLTMAEGAP